MVTLNTGKPPHQLLLGVVGAARPTARGSPTATVTKAQTVATTTTMSPSCFTAAWCIARIPMVTARASPRNPVAAEVVDADVADSRQTAQRRLAPLPSRPCTATSLPLLALIAADEDADAETEGVVVADVVVVKEAPLAPKLATSESELRRWPFCSARTFDLRADG